MFFFIGSLIHESSSFMRTFFTQTQYKDQYQYKDLSSDRIANFPLFPTSYYRWVHLPPAIGPAPSDRIPTASTICGGGGAEVRLPLKARCLSSQLLVTNCCEVSSVMSSNPVHREYDNLRSVIIRILEWRDPWFEVCANLRCDIFLSAFFRFHFPARKLEGCISFKLRSRLSLWHRPTRWLIRPLPLQWPCAVLLASASGALSGQRILTGFTFFCCLSICKSSFGHLFILFC